jgi:hypothetical protein
LKSFYRVILVNGNCFFSHYSEQESRLSYLILTYVATNIWLRHVEEDLSMSACLEHSASNLWPLGPVYCYSPHPLTWISVFLDFSFHWVWLWIEIFVVGLRGFWSCDLLNESACLRDINGIRAVKLFIEFVVVPPSVDTNHSESFLSNTNNWWCVVMLHFSKICIFLRFDAVQRVGLLLIYLSLVILNGCVNMEQEAVVYNFGEEFVCQVQEANPSIVFTIEFIALLVHWTQYPLGPASR